MTFERVEGLVNKIQILNQTKDVLNSTFLNNFLNSNSKGLSKKIENLNIYEI
jgi:hypothetical protein